jgi:hypothetical protein
LPHRRRRGSTRLATVAIVVLPVSDPPPAARYVRVTCAKAGPDPSGAPKSMVVLSRQACSLDSGDSIRALTVVRQ